jgi:hypothetical protein
MSPIRLACSRKRLIRTCLPVLRQMSIGAERVETGRAPTPGPIAAWRFDRSPWLRSLLARRCLVGSLARRHYDDGACRWCRRSSATFANTASGGSRGGAVVVAQEATEALATRSRIGVVVDRRGDRGDQSAVEALVVPLEMVVLDELRDREPEVALTERNELAQALGLEREHKPLGDRVQVGALGREFEARLTLDRTIVAALPRAPGAVRLSREIRRLALCQASDADLRRRPRLKIVNVPPRI